MKSFFTNLWLVQIVLQLMFLNYTAIQFRKDRIKEKKEIQKDTFRIYIPKMRILEKQT